MKKSVYKFLILMSLLTFSCSINKHETNGSKMPSTNSQENSFLSSTNSSIENIKLLELDNFKTCINNSKPTLVISTMTYYLSEYDIILNYSSSLQISYANNIKAIYSYSYQYLNDISSDSKDLISTATGKYCISGLTIGEMINDKINWISETEGSISFLNIDLNKNNLSNLDIENNTLTANVENNKIKDFFNQNYDISNYSFKISLNNDNLVQSFSSKHSSSKNAIVSINCNFSYLDEDVNF